MILVERDTNLIKHQGFTYILGENNVEVKYSTGAINFIFGDLNKYSSYIVDYPHIDGFICNKFIYDDGSVILNPDFSITEM